MGDISKNFSRKEFSCRCSPPCGFDCADIELIKVLEDLRKHFKNPITITSGNRCETHNKASGGSKGSKHKLGLAADARVKHTPPMAVFRYLDKKYPQKYGIGLYDSWVHIDVRETKGRW